MQNEIQVLKNAVPPLLKWYGVHKRELPWRGTRDPYKIWVSEIMLQQTRVEAVKGYYTAFLEKFPNAETLANASEEEVLKAWEGLGYYSRARNLHKAAKLIAEKGFPRDFAGVRSLPGVGDYTAGAICSIAYDLPCPAVDGNVLRVLTRLLADERNIDEMSTRIAFSRLLREVYPKEAGEFCQSLMELGAIVCMPNGEPMCSLCPWQTICAAHLAGREEEFPVRSEKKARKAERIFVYVLKKEGKFALRQREERGLLARLWEFPNGTENAAATYGKILAEKRAKHIFTHVEWEMTGYLIEAEAFFPQFLWVTPEEMRENYALPSAFKAFKEWVK